MCPTPQPQLVQMTSNNSMYNYVVQGHQSCDIFCIIFSMDHTRIDDPTLVSEQSTTQVQLQQNECYAASRGNKDKTDE